ncbi:MAG: LysE family transporter [Thermoproteales archaeon]|nr:LysE family transporter [Thermoproteales archaeon]
MDYLPIITEIIFITSSGVFSPGPLTFSIVSKGSSIGWKAGFLASVGHLIIELPLIFILALGIGESINTFRKYIAFIGGIFLIYFSIMQIKDSLKVVKGEISHMSNNDKSNVLYNNPILIGAMLSAFNPFFLLWWATAGLKIIMDVLSYIPNVILAVPFLYIFHVWMDFLWLSLIAYLSGKGKTIFGKYLGYILIFFSILMLYYAFVFISESIL